MMQTASAINEFFGRPLLLMGPATNDVNGSDASQTDFLDFTNSVVQSLAGTNCANDPSFIWTTHTYHETGREIDPPRTGKMRSALVGYWAGWPGSGNKQEPQLFCTEGGWRRDPNAGNNYTNYSVDTYDELHEVHIYNEWERLQNDQVGRGRGVGMLTNYLFYTQSDWDTGFVKLPVSQNPTIRPVYYTWGTLPGAY